VGTRAYTVLSKLSYNVPLTARGALLLCLSITAIYWLFYPEKDIFAAVVGGFFLILICLAATLVLVTRLALRKNLDMQMNFPAKGAQSGSPTRGTITLYNSALTPGITLSVWREFVHDGVQHPVHLVSGKQERRILTDTLIFPHRGYWSVNALCFRVEDCFGLSSLTWREHSESGVEISAPERRISSLPIVAASSHLGDEVSFTKNRSGDYFDIKAYDPSDGTKRILWKTFAKSGALVVRRPEPAVVPEGEVALYLVAGPDHDEVAGAAQHYIRQLEQQNIEVFFGTDGLKELVKTLAEETSYDVSGGFARSFEDTLHCINRCVWHEHTGIGDDFDTFIADIHGHGHLSSEVMVFAPEDFTPTHMQTLEQQATNRGVMVTFALVPAVTSINGKKQPKGEALTATAKSSHNSRVYVCETSPVDAHRTSPSTDLSTGGLF